MKTFIILLLCCSLTIANPNAGGDSDAYCPCPRQPGHCCDRFGLNVGTDPDVIITASSSWDASHGPTNAALFGKGHTTSWHAGEQNENQWIQVDFGHPREVTGVLLQGRDGVSQWVTSFSLLFSNDLETFDSTPTLQGSSDSNTVVRRNLARPIVARFFRLNPKTWNGGFMALRFDLLGCNNENYEAYCACPHQPGYCCDRFDLNVDPEPDVVISASSSWHDSYGPTKAALFGEGPNACWHAGEQNGDQWIQVDFGQPRKVTGVFLQGRDGISQWVTSFRLLYSNDMHTFYSTPLLQGALDSNTVVRRYLDRPIVARFFRLNPKTWHGGYAALRFDLLGCSDEC